MSISVAGVVAVRMAILATAVLAPLAAYNPPVDQAGMLTVRIDGPEQMTRTGMPAPFKVMLENAGLEFLRGHLRVAVIDGWSVAPGELEFAVDAKASREYAFQVTAAPGSYSALYPIHAFAEFRSGGVARIAHPVLIVKTEFSEAPHAARVVPWKPIAMAGDSGFALWRTPVRRVVLQVFGGRARTLPVGSEGTDTQTRANAQFGANVKRGETRECIGLHEPYFQGAGTILAEYPLALPRSPSLKLRFANATRDDTPGQTPGDGVKFRVRVLGLDAADGELGEVVFERHIKSATWFGTFDLVGELWVDGKALRAHWNLENAPAPRP